MATAEHNLDDIDRKIILELQEDARRQFKIIAKKLRVSEGTIKNRVTRLKNRGILKLEARVNPFCFAQYYFSFGRGQSQRARSRKKDKRNRKNSGGNRCMECDRSF